MARIFDTGKMQASITLEFEDGETTTIALGELTGITLNQRDGMYVFTLSSRQFGINRPVDTDEDG